jgi:hypothetical protein
MLFLLTEGSAMMTYKHRGVLEPGCNASEHAIAHLKGQQPVCLEGEQERGMTKDPIEIEPVDSQVSMSPMSRIRFGKTFSIEFNVKVREIGMVSQKHLSKLSEYHQAEMNSGWDPDDLGTTS